MANADPPAISTPSRPRYSLAPKRSGTFSTAANAMPNVAGFSPGGQVFEGYSYLSRSTSMSTSTRSRPKGLQSRSSDLSSPPPQFASHKLVTSPSSPRVPLPVISPLTSPSANNFDLPLRSKTLHRLSSSTSTPDLHSISDRAPHSDLEAERLVEAVANLPHNPKTWLPSQVALYLTHVLGLVPRPVVDDVTAYVRSSRMGGRAFLRLSEKDLERQGLNLKWRKLMIEAVRKLRRDALRGRIWGNESGSLRWPKSSHDMEREETEEDEKRAQEDDHSPLERDAIARSSKTTSKLTLKRMRDSRKVRGMIQAFQTSPEKQEVPLSSLSIDAPFGQGYVRDQAQQILSEAEEKKLSLRRPLRPRRSTADFPWLENSSGAKQHDIEALLAGLTDQEAQQLADELGIDDLQDTEAIRKALQDNHTHSNVSSESIEDVLMMPTLTRHGSTDSTSVEGESSLSECSAFESELSELDDDAHGHAGGHKPRYSVLDQDVIRAILAGDDTLPDQDETFSIDTSTKSSLIRSHTTASIVRPSRPYRASLYTGEELAALNDHCFHTRTESSQELIEALISSGQAADETFAEPDFGTARLRSAEEKVLDVPPIPSFEPTLSEPQQPSQPQQQQLPTAEAVETCDNYVFTLPDAPVRHSTNSIRRTAGRKATFGSKRGKAILSLLNSDAENSELFSSLPGASSLRLSSAVTPAAAEDEEGWGGTLSRSSSRKSLKGVFDVAVSHPSLALRKRGLERVASEAEAEALHAKMDEVECDAVAQVQEVQVPVDRYCETVLPEDDKHSEMARKPSVEQRLSSLFDQDMVTRTSDDVRDAPVDTARPPKEEQEHRDELEHDDTAAAAEGTSEVVTDPVSVDASSYAAVDAVATTPADEMEHATVTEARSTETTSCEISDERVDVAAISSSLPAITKQAENGDHGTQAQIDEALHAEHGKASSMLSSEEPLELAFNPTSAPSDAITSGSPSSQSDPQMLVPLTVLEPHPSGTGSIKKRSMVLVDRRRFESLARRMTDLEAQLESIDHPSAGSSRRGSVKGSGGLRGMFEQPKVTVEEEDVDAEVEDEVNVLEEILAATAAATATATGAVAQGATDHVAIESKMQPLELDNQPGSHRLGWRALLTPSSWPAYLSSLNPYYSSANATCATTTADHQDDLDLYALLGRPESDHERHLLTIGAIPAYMLGLGAGLGFVLVKEVLGARH